MFLTRRDWENAKLSAGKPLEDGDVLWKLIWQEEDSGRREKMEEGERYYVYEQDILKHDFRRSRISETNEAEQETVSVFTNPNRSNHHVTNGFHRLLVDQKVSYLLGRKPVLQVKNKDRTFAALLEQWAGEEFQAVFQELLTGASNKGFECIHFYYDEKGALCYCIVPANEIIPIFDDNKQDKLEQVIRYYDVVEYENGSRYVRKKVEWWTEKNVTYFTENDQHRLVVDASMRYNPAPHWWTVGGEEQFQKKREQHSWGRVPFLLLKNNIRGTTDLEAVKGLIDAYDFISSEGVNNLLDLVDLYWVIQGYGGETASAITRKLQINKAVHISDANGSVEAKQTDLSMSGRLEYLKMLRRDIFQFGQGVDTDLDRLGNAPSGVSLRYQYTLLDLKADSVAARLKKAMKEFFSFLVDDWNRANGTAFDAKDIRVELRKNMITNDYETVQMIEMSKDLLGRETLISKHPFVEEISGEEELLAMEEEKGEMEDEARKDGTVGNATASSQKRL